MKIRSNRNGFTLIELLVVITIIGVLAALAVPAINGALDKAKQTADVSNVRQLGIVLFTVANDDSGNYPGHAADPVTERQDKGVVTVFASMLKNKELADGKILTSNKSTPYAGSATNALSELKPANVGWDYVAKLSTSSESSIPLLISNGAITSLSQISQDITLTEGAKVAWDSKGFVTYTVGNSAIWNKARDKKVKALVGSDITLTDYELRAVSK